MKKKTVIILAVVLIVVLAAILGLSSKKDKGVKVTLEKVKRTDLTSIVSASGEIKPKKSINISALIPGRIVKIGVKEGDVVKAGAFLLKLDATQYEANAERDQAFIQSSRAELIKAQTTLDKNKSFYDRQVNLYDNGLISKDQLEQAKSQLDISDAGVRSINFQIQQAQAVHAPLRSQRRRAQLVSEVAEAQNAYRHGKVRRGTASDLMNEIRK